LERKQHERTLTWQTVKRELESLEEVELDFVDIITDGESHIPQDEPDPDPEPDPTPAGS
jgi:hypothetical protein